MPGLEMFIKMDLRLLIANFWSHTRKRTAINIQIFYQNNEQAMAAQISKETEAAIVKMIRAGKIIKQITDETDCCAATVRKVAKRFGIEVNRGNRGSKYEKLNGKDKWVNLEARNDRSGYF